MIVDHAASTARKPLPAFAHELADARDRGMTLKRPLVSVRLHDGARPDAGFGVVVPNDASPSALDWRWCRRLEVIIFREGDDPQRVIEAITAIEAARPRRLLVIDLSANCKIVSIIDPESYRAPR